MVEHGQKMRGSYLQSLQQTLTRGLTDEEETEQELRSSTRPSHGRKGGRVAVSCAVETRPDPHGPVPRCVASSSIPSPLSSHMPITDQADGGACLPLLHRQVHMPMLGTCRCPTGS